MVDKGLVDRVQRLLALCQEALAGVLSLDELSESWEPAIDESDVLAAIGEDLWFGVEHTPGRLLTGGTNHAQWRQTFEYRLLYGDTLILERILSGADLEAAERARRCIEGLVNRRGVPASAQEIELEVARAMGS
jgi:hypothetical protein